MTPLHSHCLDLDLHRLDLRFADSRLVEPQAVARLAESIERAARSCLASWWRSLAVRVAARKRWC
jgi:hypothetical protein